MKIFEEQFGFVNRFSKEIGDLMIGEPATEAPVNGGRNYNGPKVAKFLVG